MRRRLATTVAALGLAVSTLAGCSGDDGKALPEPGPSSSTTSTTQVDYTQVSLAGVDPGKVPPVTKPRGGGAATLGGRVIDDSGAPVAGAIVRATYYGIPDEPEVIEALSGPDGGYRFEKVYGGRWRIRAWLAPTLASLEVPSFFLGARENKALDLKVKLVPDVALTASVAPDPVLMYSPAELAVLVVTQVVDGEGRVSRNAAPATPVSLTTNGHWALQSANPVATDETGTARWTLVCQAEQPQALSVVAFGREFPVTTPSCIDPASTTTTTIAPPGESSSTSSTRPRPRTTTTTRPKGPTSSTRPPVQPR